MTMFIGTLLAITAVFLILLVLVQRGRGGGLAGALGGMGGQSAFGTKAGDLFTRITIGVATVWIILCMLSVKVMNTQSQRLAVGSGSATTTEKIEPGPDSATSTKGATTAPASGGLTAPAATTPPAAPPAPTTEGSSK